MAVRFKKEYTKESFNHLKYKGTRVWRREGLGEGGHGMRQLCVYVCVGRGEWKVGGVRDEEGRIYKLIITFLLYDINYETCDVFFLFFIV